MDPNNPLVLSATFVSKLRYAFFAQNHEFKVTMTSMLILRFQATFPCDFAVFPKILCGFAVFVTHLTPPVFRVHPAPQNYAPSVTDAVGPNSSQRADHIGLF